MKLRFLLNTFSFQTCQGCQGKAMLEEILRIPFLFKLQQLWSVAPKAVFCQWFVTWSKVSGIASKCLRKQVVHNLHYPASTCSCRLFVRPSSRNDQRPFGLTCWKYCIHPFRDHSTHMLKVKVAMRTWGWPHAFYHNPADIRSLLKEERTHVETTLWDEALMNSPVRLFTQVGLPIHQVFSTLSLKEFLLEQSWSTQSRQTRQVQAGRNMSKVKGVDSHENARFVGNARACFAERFVILEIPRIEKKQKETCSVVLRCLIRPTKTHCRYIYIYNMLIFYIEIYKLNHINYIYIYLYHITAVPSGHRIWESPERVLLYITFAASITADGLVVKKVLWIDKVQAAISTALDRKFGGPWQVFLKTVWVKIKTWGICRIFLSKLENLSKWITISEGGCFQGHWCHHSKIRSTADSCPKKFSVFWWISRQIHHFSFCSHHLHRINGIQSKPQTSGEVPNTSLQNQTKTNRRCGS